MIFYNQNFKKERLIWMKFFRCKISRSSSWRHWKYEIWKWRKSEEHSCSSNQASAIQAKKRPVLAGFLPFSAHFFAFSSSLCIYKTNFAKKIRSGLDFLAAVEAQSFCLNSGRVATAYSTDKYKYQNHENQSQLSRAINYRQTYSNSTCQCFGVSGGVC